MNGWRFGTDPISTAELGNLHYLIMPWNKFVESVSISPCPTITRNWNFKLAKKAKHIF